MRQCAPEDSISQCPFLQMIDTAGNPHADGSAAPGARPRHRPSSHRNPPATSRSHDNWMAARQTSCRQQTAPPPPRCSKDVTAHPHRPGARPGRPCPVPARSGQPLSGRSGFSPAFGTEFSLCNILENNGIKPKKVLKAKGLPTTDLQDAFAFQALFEAASPYMPETVASDTDSSVTDPSLYDSQA